MSVQNSRDTRRATTHLRRTGAVALEAGIERYRASIFAVVGAVVLLASLVNFLGHNGYSLITPEVGLAAAVLAAGAAGAGLLYAAAGGIGRTILKILLVYLAFDLNFDGIGVAVAAVAAALLLNRVLVPVLGITFLVALAANLVGLGAGDDSAEARISPSTSPTSNAPVLLHLILDEHIGVEGLPADMPEATALRRDLQSFYAQNGFRLFGGAYSEYMHTVNAIPHILNLGIEQPWKSDRRDGVTIERNLYFDRLRELGYRVKVYQTDFVDYCANPAVESCSAFRATNLEPIGAARLPTGEKAALILYGFASLSSVAKVATRLYDVGVASVAAYGIDLPLIELHKPNALGALVAFDRLIADISHAQPGEAYFMHLLLPHYPYATRPDCAIKNLQDWRLRASRLVSPESRQSAYFDQVRCATSKIGAALQALAASPAGDRSIIIVHGDHGSRITRVDPTVENADRFDERDMINGFSALFAVRAAGIEPGYEAARLPIAQLLSAVARSGFRSARVVLGPDFTPSVMLENRGWKPIRRHELPTSWTRQ